MIVCVLKLISRLCVFPGSFRFWRRNVEVTYGRLMAKRALLRLQDLRTIVVCLLDCKSALDLGGCGIKSWIVRVGCVYTEMGYRGMLTPK
jgi:hypothetical protein